eukprot:111315-Rhodomonas_salina.3
MSSHRRTSPPSWSPPPLIPLLSPFCHWSSSSSSSSATAVASAFLAASPRDSIALPHRHSLEVKLGAGADVALARQGKHGVKGKVVSELVAGVNANNYNQGNGMNALVPPPNARRASVRDLVLASPPAD